MPHAQYEIASSADMEQSATTGLYTAQLVAGDEITAVTKVTLSETWDSDSTEALWLTGFAQQSDEVPHVGIVWREVDDGWFSMWKLQLETPDGTAIELTTGKPRANTTYETTLSYDAHNNAMNWQVADVTNGSIISEGGRQVDSASTAYVLSGVLANDDATQRAVTVDNVTGYDVFVPIASSVRLVAGETGRASLTRFRRDDDIWIRLVAPGGGAPGSYDIEFIGEDEEASVTVGPLHVDEDELFVKLPQER